MIFVPFDETPEGWRRTPLGFVACLVGWHFGQIAVTRPWADGPTRVRCAGCHRLYNKIVIWGLNSEVQK